MAELDDTLGPASATSGEPPNRKKGPRRSLKPTTKASGRGVKRKTPGDNGRADVKSAHPSEAEFANILDFYGVKWL